MPRNMSFALTTEQIRNRTKTVTRRIGWDFLQPGDIVNACIKCMGLKPGEKVQRLAQIRVVSTRFEPLYRLIDQPEYGASEAAKEGFPGWSGDQFVDMLLDHMSTRFGESTLVNRIEFEYVEDQQ